MVKDNRSRPPRQKVLIVSYPDQYIEVFGENIDVHIENVLLVDSIEAECTAEDVAELSMPPRFRGLFRRDKLRKNGSTLPQRPSARRRAIAVQECLAIFDMVTAPESEAMAWTL